MKKFYTFIAALAFAVSGFAQTDGTYEFIDGATGNVIPDGSVITRNEVTDGIINSGLFLKNNGSTDFVSVKADVKDLPNGTFQICFLTQCIAIPRFNQMKYPFSGTAEPSSGELGIGKTEDLKSEWFFDDEKREGSFDVVYTIRLYDGKELIGEGSSITVHYEYPSTSGIWNVGGDANKKEVARFDISGRRIGSDTKGLVMVKYSDGSVRKLLEK